jgi:chromosome segregation protein
MRLKSLELHGYKTFASRTLFEFAGTVTAIVGPNGSGKSNIADSLRWVLGEQSYALLRGKKTEDMIFSGSEHRPRSGMASASVVFDNSDGWLPIDFSEVAVTRRAYRDGQNEYLINGQRVRLKDVSELLAQSGLAERTYTIIGQGLVDAALALKAEERRRLFEEAAGIGLHRARREEALRRLDTTRRNLDRVQDILAELQPRLRSLERQARRAQEYEQVKADLRLLLRDWYGYHWHHAQRDLTATREACRAQENVLERARQEQAGHDEKLAGLRDQLQGLRARLSSWHRQSAQHHTRREDLSRQRAVTDERIRSLHEQRQNIEAELVRLQEEAGLRQEQAATAQEDVKRLEMELAEARQQAEAAGQGLRQRQAERQRVEKDLQADRQTLSGLNARQGNLQARQSERQTQAERQQKAVEAAGQAVEAAQKELDAAQERSLAAARAQAEAEAARQQADKENQAHRQRISEAEAAYKSAVEDRSARLAEQARLQAQLDVLKQAEHALSGYAAGAQILLKAARQERLKGTRGALSSSLEVPFELETAIAAALGEYLDALVLERSADTTEALEALAAQSARGVLLPLDALKPPTPLFAYSPEETGEKGNGDVQTSFSEHRKGTGDGVLGIAAELVGAPAELRPAVDLLLGQVIVARDRDAALRALRGLADQGTSARAVTLRGEVYHASGPVQAGAPGQGALSRPRQLREISQALQAAKEQAAALDERGINLKSELSELQAEEKRLVEAQRAARRQEELATQAHSQEKLAVEHARRQQRWQAEQCDRLNDEIQRSAAQASQIAAELAELAERITQAREAVRSKNSLLNSLPLEEYQAQSAHWNALVSAAERSLAAGKNRVGEQQGMLDRAKRALSAAQRRLEELEATVAALEAEKVAQREAETEVNAQIEAFQVLIGPAEAELLEAETEQEKLQPLETAARQTLSIAEHHYAQLRIAQGRSQEALDSLRRRIEDDFGLVAFEFADEIAGQTPLPLEGMVEELPHLTKIPPDLEENVRRQRAMLRRMGAINPEAQAEYQEVKERYAFLTSQVADLEKAEADVRQVIAELDELMQREFRKTFDAVAEEFKTIFSRLFGGGAARLVLTDPDDLTNTGIDIEARLPGRRMQGLSLLSGGERSLTAVSLVFALLRIAPTPFCVLDEVDAMLDEANVGRFRDLLRELSQNTQFIVVTHNRNTVQVADVIYGVTMGRDSASQVISLKLDEVEKVVGAA